MNWKDYGKYSEMDDLSAIIAKNNRYNVLNNFE
jgi:hypothetical protein